MKCTAVAQQRSNGRECSEHCECCRLPLDPGLIQLPKEEQLATPIPKVVLRDCVQERLHRSYTEMVSDSIQDSILDGTNIVTSGSRRETYIILYIIYYDYSKQERFHALHFSELVDRIAAERRWCALPLGIAILFGSF